MLRRLHVATIRGIKMNTATPTRPEFHGTIDRLREIRPRIAASLERLDLPEGGPHQQTFARLLQELDSFSASSRHDVQAAVLANMFEVVARGDAEDYAETALLSQTWGKRIAQVQNEFEDQLGIAPNRPYTTAAILRLARGEHIRGVLTDAGHTAADAERIAAECGKVALRLLLEGVDGANPVPLPDSPELLRLIVEKRGVSVWRALLANIAANPFGPEARQLTELAHEAELPPVALVVEACTRAYRKRIEVAERLEVSREIRRLVAISGCSQRRFAAHIGTSASRLSTYVNGLVTPSATLMVRIRWAAAELTPSMAERSRLAS
ncbi:helix-turn-helix transcriptional regulator [Nocardioides sp. HM23]|uniref:helix-turn-helix transcriptional regulator n=1 Tax=Nocardioides bizhenqiangii TaxID=3095076 RepID=UPI002ACA9DF3|nr:helix-turn-helix transcriptional regulator [Nocardioides sp. HM23]MDZ5620153.1 helix-turn-helix transcriptional regulator [Nocardioides sp. HM23]MDZ5623438.1 helix-turn-helix transcriptional regulator [Nocardioides sp. HM23]